MKSILDKVPEKADKIEVLQIDVGEYRTSSEYRLEGVLKYIDPSLLS